MVKVVSPATVVCGGEAWQALVARIYPGDLARRIFGVRRRAIGGLGNGSMTGGLYAKDAR